MGLFTQIYLFIPEVLYGFIYPLVMTFTVCHGKIHHAMKIGKTIYFYGPWLNHGIPQVRKITMLLPSGK